MEPFRISGHDISEVVPQAEMAPVSAPKISRGTFDWPRLHPYMSALIGAGILLVGGIVIVSWRSAVGPSGSAGGAWGGANINLLNPAYNASQKNTAQQNQSGTLRQTQGGAPYSYIPPISGGAAFYAPSGDATSFDFDSFIKLLSQGSAAQTSLGTSSGSDADLLSAYAFIPTGLVSTATPVKKRTVQQQQLYDYGNEAGSYIQSFEEAHRDQAQVLKNWLEDRKDAAKAAAVVQLGRALWEIGRSLSGMESVPSSAKAAHGRLAKSYLDIGANLALVPKVETDADLLKAIGAYNASADVYATNYVALVNIFGAYGVGFSADDPGSVFTFTNSSL